VKALEAGADGCLTEPIEPPVLVATVRALIRARLAEDALRDALAREQVARVAAEAANTTKDEFLATLSHELRSPLGGVLTWVAVLRSGRLDPKKVAHAHEAIERSARLQMRLIDDLLDVSRIISGKMVLDIGLVDLGDVIEAACEIGRATAEAKGIGFGCTVGPGLGLLSGDAGRLQQIVWNLVNNAVKFTPRGGRVDLRVEREGPEVGSRWRTPDRASSRRSCRTSSSASGRRTRRARDRTRASASGWRSCATWSSSMAARSRRRAVGWGTARRSRSGSRWRRRKAPSRGGASPAREPGRSRSRPCRVSASSWWTTSATRATPSRPCSSSAAPR
jgi:hypothetical protein